MKWHISSYNEILRFYCNIPGKCTVLLLLLFTASYIRALEITIYTRYIVGGRCVTVGLCRASLGCACRSSVTFITRGNELRSRSTPAGVSRFAGAHLGSDVKKQTENALRRPSVARHELKPYDNKLGMIAWTGLRRKWNYVSTPAPAAAGLSRPHVKMLRKLAETCTNFLCLRRYSTLSQKTS